jgi:hypothetical protein
MPKRTHSLENGLRTSVRLARPPALECRDGILQPLTALWYHIVVAAGQPIVQPQAMRPQSPDCSGGMMAAMQEVVTAA